MSRLEATCFPEAFCSPMRRNRAFRWTLPSYNIVNAVICLSIATRQERAAFGSCILENIFKDRGAWTCVCSQHGTTSRQDARNFSGRRDWRWFLHDTRSLCRKRAPL